MGDMADYQTEYVGPDDDDFDRPEVASLTHYNKGQCIVLCGGSGRLMSRDIHAVTCITCLDKLHNAGEDPRNCSNCGRPLAIVDNVSIDRGTVTCASCGHINVIALTKKAEVRTTTKGKVES